VVNYSRPDPRYGDTLHFDAAYEAPPNLVKQAVARVLAEHPDVLRTPASEVRVMQYADSSVKYAIRYWITDFAKLEVIRNQIMTSIWYALRRANVRIPFPARDLFIHSEVPAATLDCRDIVSTLRQVSLFTPLDDAVLGRLALRVRRQTFGAGEVVVEQGEPGNSFYVIEQGAADVILGADGATQTVGHLALGEFFGEMSLLAGDARSATVRAATDLTVLVVDHDAFKEIISADPAILEPLSEIAARRQALQQEHRRSRESARAVDTQGAQRLHERIKAFFGL